MYKPLFLIFLTTAALTTPVEAAVALPQPRFAAQAALAGNTSGLLLTQTSSSAGSVSVTYGGIGVHTTVGADQNGVPFISLNGSTNDRRTVSASAAAAMFYNWTIIGNASFGELVPITITTLGNFSAELTARSLVSPATPVKASLNWLDIGVHGRFETWSVGGLLDTQNYGVYSGVSRSGSGGGTPVVFDELVSQPSFSSVSANGNASFNKTITLLAQPNQMHSISMFAWATEGGSSWQGEPGYSSNVGYSYTFGAYLDPIITIDPAYAGRFSVVQSAIPIVSVPEPSSLVMLLVGLGLLCSRRLRCQ